MKTDVERKKAVEYQQSYVERHQDDPGFKERLNGYKSKWRRNNPEKYRAHAKVNNAVRDGKLQKPDRCSRCKKRGKVHAHHEDYSRPLDVIWLCPECHGKERHVH